MMPNCNGPSSKVRAVYGGDLIDAGASCTEDDARAILRHAKAADDGITAEIGNVKSYTRF